MPRSKAQVTVPVSIHQETKLLKKFIHVSEVKEEMAGLLAKAIATLDWLLENGTPGTKLGAAQTVLMPFIPRAPQVVENLNYDVADLDPERQEQVIRLAKEYRSVLGATPPGRGPVGETEDRRLEAQALLLGPHQEDDTLTGSGWDGPPRSTPEPLEGPDPGRGEQEREEHVGDGRVDSLESESSSLQDDPAGPDVSEDRHS